VPETTIAPADRAGAAVDEALAESFPASDPPSWTPGIVRPAPKGGAASGSGMSDVLWRASGRRRTFRQGVLSFAGATGLALLVPVAILIVGLPVVLAVRGLLAVAGWLFGVALE
jgi:hypothetical protein